MFGATDRPLSVYLDAGGDPEAARTLVQRLAPELRAVEADALVRAAPVCLGSWTAASLPIAFAAALGLGTVPISTRTESRADQEGVHSVYLAVDAPASEEVKALLPLLFRHAPRNFVLIPGHAPAFVGFLLVGHLPNRARLFYLQSLGVRVELRGV